MIKAMGRIKRKNGILRLKELQVSIRWSVNPTKRVKSEQRLEGRQENKRLSGRRVFQS